MSWHYDQYEIASSTMFLISFQNAETKQSIQVFLPSTGIFHKAQQRTKAEDVKKIAGELRKVFKRILD
ncbi:MAG: hypothetical protein PHX83_05420 [Acidobacteriia bacterium]|nr:hypothetical protein [Terriglobia bacterium]